MTKTCYICDGKACKKALYCRNRNPKNWLCAHTTNSAHAVNGPCPDPWKHPERFEKQVEGKNTWYTEKL